MTRFLKILVLWLVVGAMVWLFTLWHWQQSGRDVNLADIVGYLFVLPTAIVAVWLLALWGLARVRAKAADAAVPSMAKDQGGDPMVSTDEAMRQAHAWVLDATVCSRAGRDALSTWSGLQAGQTRPDLDAHLQDLDGLPVFSARVADLEPAMPDDDGGTDPAEALSGAALRALALLSAPCDQLADSWMQWIDTLTQAGAPEAASGERVDAQGAAFDGVSRAYLSGVAHRLPADEAGRLPPVTWRVRLLMPVQWSEVDQDAIVRCAHARLAEVSESTQAQGLVAPQWEVTPPETPEAWWAEFDAHLQRWRRDGAHEAMLIVAVDSALDEATIDQWQSMGALFTAQHQTGRIPGEAAAGMLVVSPALYDRVQAHGGAGVLSQPAVKVSRPVRLQRDKSADAIGRVGATTLTEAMQQALSLHGVPPSANLMVVADADHRASRTAELFEALQAVMPGLDPMTHVARAGEALGDVGAARSVLSTALGCAAVWRSEGEHVAVAAHVQSTHDRVVLALSTGGALSAAPV